ncbi:TetR/AcrR family transcriptional regulator [Williamsia sterculiae]|uniref:Transcriptional regulator, TetR family n=1 Tax=Williamsia sterculiae TaxID=1344003 RepID=A0A1N7H6Q7_9NOCA|nr:TetR/AcrR family transcriptional regulator [Williamsia sterculiae]SIS20502.1 transcriptional regulator, TetR family [Williamsia sterculiae]
MPTRAENRREIESQIVRLGRDHLRTHGAAGLSLRAIARDLGMVSSAVYRYVANRDDLLTLLLVQGYTDLADTVDTALSGTGNARAQLVATATAVRTWAIGDPARWALLYGSPVPGYQAPADQTSVPGTRVVGRILEILSAVTHAPETDQRGYAALTADFDTIRDQFDVHVDDALLARGIAFWSTMIGAVSLEVFGQYGTDTLRDPTALFDAVIADAADRVVGD